MDSARNMLLAAYREYLNNYITTGHYAECNGLTYEQAKAFINLAREVAYSNHPES